MCANHPLLYSVKMEKKVFDLSVSSRGEQHNLGICQGCSGVGDYAIVVHTLEAEGG